MLILRAISSLRTRAAVSSAASSSTILRSTSPCCISLVVLRAPLSQRRGGRTEAKRKINRSVVVFFFFPSDTSRQHSSLAAVHTRRRGPSLVGAHTERDALRRNGEDIGNTPLCYLGCTLARTVHAEAPSATERRRDAHGINKPTVDGYNLQVTRTNYSCGKKKNLCTGTRKVL